MFPVLQTPSSPGLPYVHSIKHVTVTDQGMYTCVARNVVGRAYAAAYLQVNAAPVLGPPLLWVLRHQTCKRCVAMFGMENTICEEGLPIWVGHSAFLVSYYIFLLRVHSVSIPKKVKHHLHVWPSSYNFNMILISCPIPSCPHKSRSVVEFRISTTLKLW